MHNALFITLSLFASSALASQTFACGKAKIPLRIDPTTGWDVTQQTCLNVNNNDVPYYQFKDGDKFAKLVQTDKIPTEPTTCEHIVEVQLLKEVLESKKGPCDQLMAVPESDVDKRKAIRDKFRHITNILNSAPNLLFAGTKLEKQKGDMVNKARTGAKPYQEKKSDPNLRQNLMAVDYFINVQTTWRSDKAVKDLDDAIAHYFPGTADTVAAKWAPIKSFAHTCYSKLKPPTLEPEEQTSLTNMVVQRVLRILNIAP